MRRFLKAWQENRSLLFQRQLSVWHLSIFSVRRLNFSSLTLTWLADCPGSTLKKERTYLGQQKEHSISLDLTKLQGQMQYLRDHRISQAHSQYEKQIAAASQANAEDDAQPVALDAQAPAREVQDTERPQTAKTNRLGPRVGTIKRVSRPSSASSAAPVPQVTGLHSTVRPQSATGSAHALCFESCALPRLAHRRDMFCTMQRIGHLSSPQ